MDEIRTAGTELADKGAVAVLQQGQRVDPRTVRGPVRYGLKSERN